MIEQPLSPEDERLEREEAERVQKLRGPLSKEAAKLAMFDELVEALAAITFEYMNPSRSFWKEMVALLDRAIELRRD
jgi:hypothetical protein